MPHRHLARQLVLPCGDQRRRPLAAPAWVRHRAEKPVIIPEGEKLVENDRSVSADLRLSTGTSITVTGSSGVNIAAHSPRTSQTAVVTLTGDARQHLLNLADYLDQALTGAGGETVAETPQG